MVRLNRIYTKTGDDGTTALGNGIRVPKEDLRIDSYGTVDELSSVLGLALALPEVDRDGGRFDAMLLAIQHDLFDLGADLCVPPKPGEKPRLRITPAYVERLEGWIDEHNEDLEALTSFILPGGKPFAAWMHLARTVSRRAERICCALARREGEVVGTDALHYLNRLSDLFFVIGRAANDGGKADILWKPGSGQ